MKTTRTPTTTANNKNGGSAQQQRKRKGYENRDEQVLKKKQKNSSYHHRSNDVENLFTQDQENYLFGTHIGGKYSNFSAQDNYSYHCYPSAQQSKQQQLQEEDVNNVNSNFFDIFDDTQNGQQALLDDYYSTTTTTTTGNKKQQQQPRGMFFDYFCNMDNDEYYPLDPFMTEEVISTVPGIDNATTTSTTSTTRTTASYPDMLYDTFSPSVMESRVPLCTLPSVFDESPDQVDAEDEFLHPSQHELDVRILRSDEGEDEEDLDTGTSTPSDTSSSSSEEEEEEAAVNETRQPIKNQDDNVKRQVSEIMSPDLSFKTETTAAAVDLESAPSSDLDDHTAYSDDEEDSDYIPESTTAASDSKSSSTRRSVLQEPKNTRHVPKYEQQQQQRDYDQVLSSLMNNDSMPSPYKKELTPAERNAIITEEMMQLTQSNQSHKLMILSPERNRHKTFDIPRKDITSRGESQDPTLKIGSGSEKKFKYFLHVLFKNKQTSVPMLELTKEGDASETEIPKALRIHQSNIIEGGMMARYSMSFLINSFEHERKSFHLVVKDAQTGETLVRSVPFKLNARKTTDCLFHMKAATPTKKKSTRKN